jgi:hypothetical protein
VGNIARGFAALVQFAEREGHTLVHQSHVETFEGADHNLGKWVKTRRETFKSGSMPSDQIDPLEAVPGWEWSPEHAFAGDFPRGLAALVQFAEREGHARVHQGHVETVDGADHNLGSWVASRRASFKSGSMPSDQIGPLEAVPGWEWSPGRGWFPGRTGGPREDWAFESGLAALAQFVEREGHARVPSGHVESVEGVDHNLGPWASEQRQKYRTGKLPPGRVAILEAFPSWMWDAHGAKFPRGLGALAQFAEREGHVLVPLGHVESFDGGDYNLGSWVSAKRQNYRTGKLPSEQVVALEAFPGWAWEAREALREQAFERGLAALVQFAEREGHALVPMGHVEPFEGADHNLGVWVMARRAQFKEGSLSTERVAALEAFPGWGWEAREALREQAFERGLAALAQFVERESHSRVVQTHVESYKGADYNLGVWVMARRAQFKEGGLSTERVAALEAFPGWGWGRKRGNSAVAFERGLAALAQFVEREGHARVPHGHVELFEGTEYPLGDWASARRQFFKRGKMPSDQRGRLEAFPGWDWVRKRGNPRLGD